MLTLRLIQNERDTGRAARARGIPGIAGIRVCVVELFHPRAQLCLGEHREFLQVLAAVKIVRGQMAGVKALPVEWDPESEFAILFLQNLYFVYNYIRLSNNCQSFCHEIISFSQKIWYSEK